MNSDNRIPILSLFKPKSNECHGMKLPYIIAEAGVNHEGNLDTAKRLIEQAAEGGANAIKFQTYKASTLASQHSPAYWDTDQESTTNQFALFSKFDKFWKNEFEQLKRHCEKQNIEFLSTPFDIDSANFLNDLMKVFKISSSDITNKPFIKHICSFNKPIILSTGASNINEIQNAVSWIDADNIPLALLHCVLNYPTLDHDANLQMIKNLKFNFPDKVIGYSDHTLPKQMKILEIASLLGAVILEKHFTHDKSLIGNDHYHAMDKKDLKKLIKNLEFVYCVLGDFDKRSLSSENSARENARRSLVASCYIPSGTILTDKHITWKRPGTGICPSKIESLLGKITNMEILEDELFSWEKIENS